MLPGGEVAVNATFGGPPAGNPERILLILMGLYLGLGSWVYWTDETTGRIYVRVNGATTVPVSEGHAQYWTSADEGRYAFYVEGEQLYRYDAVSESREASDRAGWGCAGCGGRE